MDDLKDSAYKNTTEFRDKIHPEIKLFFSREKRFFGPGPYSLLSLVQKKGSLRDACLEMGISYSKGWKIIKNAEEQIGFAIVKKTRGGATRGSTVLTNNGVRLLEFYETFNKESKQLVLKAYEKSLDKLFGNKN